MNIFVIALRRLIAVVCAALFLVGAVWNLFCTSPLPLEEGANTVMAQPVNDTDVLFVPKDSADPSEEDTEVQAEQRLEHRIAALRMERDTGWQQLYHTIAPLDTAEQQQLLQQYAQLQHKEQRLELLLSAKGFDNCLVVLEVQQANVIVSAEQLQDQYAKLYDLVLRNTDYTQTQIVLIPLV